MQEPHSETGPESLSPAALLGHVEDLHAQQRAAECEILRLAAEWALINDEQTIVRDHPTIPGDQRAVRYGSAGTPLVAEFADAYLGPRLQLSPRSARLVMGDALDLKFRLPNTWARVLRHEARASYARHVAKATRQLTVEQAGYVDERVVEAVDGRIPWSRFEALVEGLVVAADTEAAAAREEAARQAHYANPSRRTEHGMRDFHIRAPLHVIARLDAIVTHLAEAIGALGHTGTVDERRVLAVLALTDPGQALDLLRAHAEEHDGPGVDLQRLLPTAVLYLHLYPGSDVVRVEGHGPVTRQWVHQHLGLARFRIQPVLDLAGLAPVDAYEIPQRHRQAVHLMTPADTFPFASSTSRDKQIDHTQPYRFRADRPPGQSRIGYYGPLGTYHHRFKTHGGTEVVQPSPGIYVWQDKYGGRWLVDHTGTRRLPMAHRLDLYVDYDEAA